MPAHSIIYALDDRPPLGRALVLALQHMLTMFGATVAVPLLLGPSMGMSQVQIGVLISSVMLCSGLATFIQTTFGSRLPIVQGVSFSFLAAFFAIIAAGQEQGWDGATMMQYIAGSIIVGALIEIVVGFSGLVGRLRRALSPVVVGPVIMLIGLALFKHGAPKAGTCWSIGGLTILLVIVFSLLLARRWRFFRIFPILSAVLIVCTLCGVLSVTGVLSPEHPAHMNLGAVKAGPWVRANPADVVLPWGAPKFALGFIIAALAGYLASVVESFGDYHACSYMAGAGDPTPRQISRGIGCEGIGCLLTGLLGGFSSTSYSENIGLVGLTRVASRYVVQLAAGMLILLGIFGKFGAFAATIPGPVVGGLYCALFGLIAAVGIQQLAKADLSSDRNLFIAGFSLFMGLSVPAYFDGSVAAMYPPGAEPLLDSLPGVLADAIKAIGETGMAVAAVIGVVLDNVIPGTPAERGLKVPSLLVPEAADAGEGGPERQV
ncbi:MAG TPA: solute carrier family 23 protein [Phycisphaerae bacterium]|nr:solute carrier family 23 protein [Phycisphaerae bacterium]